MEPPRPGDSVIVHTGPFVGSSGRVIELVSMGREAVVEIAIFGRQGRVTLKLEELRPDASDPDPEPPPAAAATQQSAK